MVGGLERVVAILSKTAGIARTRLSSRTAIDQDFNIGGDDAEELIDAPAAEFGDWLYDWPWQSFIDLNEPPSRLGPRVWKFFRLPNPSRAFPGYTERRLEIGHIAAVIENGAWFDP